MTAIKGTFHIVQNFVSRFNREYIYIGCTLLIALGIFWSFPPLYSYDSAWYLTYTDYFSGNAPITEWNNIRGFTLPFILWIARIIKAGSSGVQIVLCFFYMLFGLYVFKILRLIKKSFFHKRLNVFDCIFVFIFTLMSSILWGYFHYVLTECIAVSLLVVFLFYTIKFYIDRKTHGNIVAKSQYIFFTILSCIMTILFWFLKQSFIANTIFVVAIFELLIWLDKINIKKVLYSLGLAICIIASLACSIDIWNGIIDLKHDHTSSLANRLNYMRYIVPESLRKGGIISVMNDNWEMIDSFEYNYDSTYSSVLKYWGNCLAKHPNRVLIGYIDNYMLIADLFQDPNADRSLVAVHKQGPVIRDRLWETISGQYEGRNMAGEHVTLVRSRLLHGYNNKSSMLNNIEMLDDRGYPTSMLDDYIISSSPNPVTKFLGSNGYWTFTTFVYAVLLVAAPFIFIVCFGLYALKGKNSLVGLCSALSFYSFLFVLMHVVEGMNIDRYAVPAYAAMLVLLIIVLSYFTEILLDKLEKKKETLKGVKNV